MTAELAVAAACMARGLSAEDADEVWFAIQVRLASLPPGHPSRHFRMLDHAIEQARGRRIAAVRGRTIADCATCGQAVTGTHVCRWTEDQ